MTYKVSLTRKASRQLKAAARWWAENRSVAQAEQWLGGFVAAIQSLEKNPHRCPVARENPAFPIEIRELLYGMGDRRTHRAVFTIRKDRVVVYAVRHHAQREITPGDLLDTSTQRLTRR